jgi:hypothetical protein
MERLQEHEIVSISLSETTGRSAPRSLDAVVLAFSDRGVALDLIDKAQITRLPEIVPDALLASYASGRGLFGLRGTIVLSQPSGHLRFIVADAATRRKEGTRISYEVPIALSPRGSSRAVEGTTMSVGPDGLTVAADVGGTSGELLRISFAASSGDEQIEGTAEVVSNVAGVVKLKFDLNSAALRAELGDIVVAESRARFSRTHSRRLDLVF